MAELMSLLVAGRENIKTVGSKNASQTFVGDHWEKYWGFVGMGWDGMGLKMRIGNWGEDFEIERWDWDYENRHWANTDALVSSSHVLVSIVIGSTSIAVWAHNWFCP